MNFNPYLMAQIVNCKGNPKQAVCNLIQQSMGNNPFFSNLLALAQAGRGNEIQTIARNMMKEKGLDFDKEFNTFREIFKF